jgi:cellulose synthase (UDP-forming)
LFTNAPIAHASYWRFLLHSLPVTVIAFMIWLWSSPWHFPQRLRLSWRSIILHIARWPIVWSALIQVILGVQKPYMITVKGLQVGKLRPFSLQPHYPYFLLIGLSLASCWFYLAVFHHSAAQGYLFFALQGAAILMLVYTTALLKDIADMVREGIALVQVVLLRARPLLLLTVMVVLLIGTAILAFPDIYAALSVTQ